MSRGYLYVLMCYILIGISYPVANSAMDQIPIWLFTSETFAIGLILLWPLVVVYDKVDLRKIGGRAWLAIGIQSMLGSVLYTVFLLYGFASATVIAASIFSSLAPAAVLTLSSIFLKERLSTRKVFAIILAIAGVLVLTCVKSVQTYSSWGAQSYPWCSSTANPTSSKIIRWHWSIRQLFWR